MDVRLAVLVGACAQLGLACTAVSRLDLEVEPEPVPTIAVTNRGIEPLKLYDRYGYVGRVAVGETRCFEMRRQGEYWLTASYNLYQAVRSPVFQPEANAGWTWEIGTFSMKYDALRLVPAQHPCRVKGRGRLAPG